MNQDIMNDNLLKFEHDLIMVRNFLENLPKEIQTLQNELKMKDDETQDLLHYMELKKFSAKEGHAVAKEMKLVRQERRKIKDLLDIMEVAHSKFTGDIVKINVLNEAIGEVRKVNKKKGNRHYNPRVRVDLKNAINESLS